MRTLYLVSKCLPRVCMGGSNICQSAVNGSTSAPRVHGWFRFRTSTCRCKLVCPACAWVVPRNTQRSRRPPSLPRVCMGGSYPPIPTATSPESAPRVHGWFQGLPAFTEGTVVCPACAWVVPGIFQLIGDSASLPRVCMGGSCRK